MKEKVNTPLIDQETIINIDPRQINEKAAVYTNMPNYLQRMWKLHEQYPDDVEVYRDDKYGTEFRVPRDWVKVKPKRQMSEEQRQLLIERLASYRTTDDEEEDDIED